MDAIIRNVGKGGGLFLLLRFMAGRHSPVRPTGEGLYRLKNHHILPFWLNYWVVISGLFSE
jgi:hypothetical protein